MLALRNVRHRYDGEVVLDVPRFDAGEGAHWLVLGLSGSGKTTLLHLAGGLVQPTEGTVVVAGQDLGALSGAALDRFRGRHIGIVFQQLHLLKTLTVEDNVLLAPYLAGLEPNRARAREVLARVDLADQRTKYPAQLSTGQRQRVAIARAVINRPRLLLADEPTASLDDVRSARVLDLLTAQAEATGATLVIATHDRRVKDRFPRRLDLDAGRVTADAVQAAGPERAGKASGDA
jgi:putative ABC transport system ATP-binding protein